MKLMYADAGVKDEATDKTVKTYAALTLISASCHAVLNTSLICPEPRKDDKGNDKFPWFDDLQKRLDDAKVVARDWLDNVVVPIQAAIPTSVIDFNAQFQTVTDMVLQICDKSPNMKKGDADYNDVVQLLQSLVDTIETDIIVPIENSREQLKKWGQSLQKAHDELSGKVKVIQDAEIDLATKIENLNQEIDNLNRLIKSESTLVSVGGGLVGGGVFVGIVGVALIAAGAGVAGGIVIGIGAAMVIGGAVTWGVMQDKINKQYNQIASDRKEIDADKLLLVSLKGIESGTTLAVSNLETALSALDEVKTMWQGFENIIKSTLGDLEKAEEQPTKILIKMFTQSARSKWAEANKMAEQLLGTNVKVENKGKIGDEAA